MILNVRIFVNSPPEVYLILSTAKVNLNQNNLIILLEAKKKNATFNHGLQLRR